MANSFYSLLLHSAVNTLELTAEGIIEDYALRFPINAPSITNNVLRWNNTELRFEWVPYNPGVSGLTSVGIALSVDANAVFSVTNSPLTANGNIGLEFDDQAPNLVLASPNGVLGKPVMRALQNTDMPAAISASKISGVLAAINIPNGTNATSFLLNASGTGYAIKNEPTGIKIVANDGTTVGDLFCNNLNVSGTVNQTNVTELNVEDQFINLLAPFTSGVPSLNGGVRLKRGGQSSAQVLWSETKKLWTIGTELVSEVVTRTKTINITNASLTAGIYIWNHGLSGETFPNIVVTNNLNVNVGMRIIHNTIDQSTIYFTRVGVLTGTWRLTARA